MEKQKKKFKVINIETETYNLIKKYCDQNSLKISKWVGSEIKKLILEKVNQTSV